jgi:hypothetical protein
MPMADQLDLLAFIASAPAAPAVKQSLTPAAPPPAAIDTPIICDCRHARPCHLRTALALGQISPASLEAMCVTLLRDLPGDRVALGPVGWDAAMIHRTHLVRQQLAGTLAIGDSHALAALSHLMLHDIGRTDDGAVIVPARAYEHLQDGIAGLRCAAIDA